MLAEETLSGDTATVGTLSEPAMADVRLGAGIVNGAGLTAGGFADSRLIELRPADGALPDGSVGPRGSTVATVVEGATKLTSVLGGKSTEGKLTEGPLIEGISVEGTLIDGKLAEDLPTEPILLDGSAIEFKPTDTRGTLTGATLGTVT